MYSYVRSNPTNYIDPYGIYVLESIWLYLCYSTAEDCRARAITQAERTITSETETDDAGKIAGEIDRRKSAYRHCLGSCELVQQMNALVPGTGNACAEIAGAAWEARPQNPDSPEEIDRDRQNNAHGRACAREVSCTGCCIRKLYVTKELVGTSMSEEHSHGKDEPKCH